MYLIGSWRSEEVACLLNIHGLLNGKLYVFINQNFHNFLFFLQKVIVVKNLINFRNYKSGYVWHDLALKDIIHPSEGGAEYVLKGSELVEGSCSG
jgi:hypothetical protein